MIIKTSDIELTKKFIKQLNIPNSDSHKGQNGKLLIIGGSSLFHAASLWAAEMSSHIVDMVHYSSTEENDQIFINLKSKFTNGIVIHQKDLFDYASEDDCILIGPGMLRGDSDEAKYTRDITKKMIDSFPNKKFVFDAGALQMMDPEWLLKLKTKPIITPHSQEFEKMFNLPATSQSVLEISHRYQTIVLMKNITDYISDGEQSFEIVGGNPGLTKGGTGDVLAGLIASLNTKNNQLTSSITGSILLKKASEELGQTVNNWYNTEDLIKQIPKTLQGFYH
jgi:NAD(P)H-hydrate epimerase